MSVNRKPQAKSSSAKKSRKSREELNAEGRARKRQRKHRGHEPGTRHNVESQNNPTRSGSAAKVDSRIGSKKPVPLLPEGETPIRKPLPEPLSPEQELAKLEQDEHLDSLLERMESGEILSQEESDYVERTLDRIEALMVQLGLSFDEEEEMTEEPEMQEDIMALIRQTDSKKPR